MLKKSLEKTVLEMKVETVQELIDMFERHGKDVTNQESNNEWMEICGWLHPEELYLNLICYRKHTIDIQMPAKEGERR